MTSTLKQLLVMIWACTLQYSIALLIMTILQYPCAAAQAKPSIHKFINTDYAPWIIMGCAINLGLAILVHFEAHRRHPCQTHSQN